MAKCPEHNVQLIYKHTRFGPRGQCPVRKCTVAYWANDETATPADHETRRVRREAHRIFDGLWREKGFSRTRLYKKLAHHLGLPINKTHIGQFDKEQCQKVIEFAELMEQENRQ